MVYVNLRQTSPILIGRKGCSSYPMVRATESRTNRYPSFLVCVVSGLWSLESVHATGRSAVNNRTRRKECGVIAIVFRFKKIVMVRNSTHFLDHLVYFVF